jgi:glutamate carboxypeptidase
MNTRPVQRRTSSKTSVSKEILEWLQAQQREMVDAIRQLVLRESPSHNKQAVDALGRELGSFFSDAGGRVTMHRGEEFGDHLQADFEGGSGSRVLLLGHFDTVWDVGTLSQMPFREERARLWGPGVLDMKTGIVQMLFALRGLQAVQRALPRPVSVLLVSDEEVGSDSSRAITERLAKQCGSVLVLEPSFGLQGAVKTARKGVGDYRVQVTGRAAHAGLDFEKGASAILELSRQLLKIEKFTDVRNGITVNPGLIRGGTRNNVVAAEAVADVDIRIARLSQAAGLEKKFRGLKAIDRRCKVSVRGGINRPPLERSEAVVRMYELARKLGSELGLKLKEAAVGGGSDGNFTAALGIPTLDGLGAPGEGAHATHESVLVEQIAPRTALLARLIESV